MVSAAWRVICSGSGSTDRTTIVASTIVASTIVGSPVTATAVNAAAIYTGLINGNPT
jgi:hypothetical protein